MIADGVWGAQTTVNIGMGAHLPLRMTVLRDDSGLLLVSPIAIDSALAAEIAKLGDVHTLVGPNRLHYQHLEAAQRRYPKARLLGAPGLAEKCPTLTFDGVIEAGQLSEAIEVLAIEGADKLSERVLWHRPSRTLVVTDCVFNIPGASGMAWFILKFLSGTLGRFEQSRLIRSMTNDRLATARSVEAILGWPIERVVMAHGEVAEGDVVERLRAGLWWWRGVARAA